MESGWWFPSARNGTIQKKLANHDGKHEDDMNDFTLILNLSVLAFFIITAFLLVLILQKVSRPGEDTRALKDNLNNLELRLSEVNRSEARHLREELSTTLNQTRREVTDAVTKGLKELQDRNEAKLEQMRQTVDEKLHKTLETRLTQSFDQVTRHLVEVQKGLAQMQTLAQDVGGLKKVLTNVKTRGIYGEAALLAVLNEYLGPDQFLTNAAVKPHSQERVEFAVKLPGPEAGATVLLPIDSKFPREDYERMQEAFEAGEKEAFEAAGQSFEKRLRAHAADIASKYIQAPQTTDFALMFLPFESIYAEAIRRPGLFQEIQHRYKVVITGPTTLTAFLNSLQVGFKTLAISRQSAEVWKVLGAVRTEFGKFGTALTSVQKNLDSATNHLSSVSSRTRAMERKLREVESLPEAEVDKLIPADGTED